MAAVPGVRRSELGDALRACRGAFVGVGVMSCMINVLYLTGSLFMLEVYDRVLPSRSVPTLLGLCSIAALLYFFQGFLDVVRSRILLRVGSALTPRVFDLIARLPLKVGASCDSLQPLRDLDQIGNFMSGIGPAALCDLPWVPIYVVICWAFHPLLGIAALGGSLLLFSLTLWTEVTTRKPAQDTGHAAGKRVLEATRAKSNAEVLLALGMRSRLSERWIVTSA